MSKYFDIDRTYKMARTLFQTFMTSVVGSLLVFGVGVLDLNSTDAKAILASGIAATLMVLYKFLNPGYTDYGLGSEPTEGD